MNLTCQLKGTYEDIRHLRQLAGWSTEELAEALGKTPSQMSRLETGKTNLSLAEYHFILKVLDFPLHLQTQYSTQALTETIQTKGAMYMKQSQKELAKDLINQHFELMKEEYCEEVFLVHQRLMNLFDEKEPMVTIPNSDYAVYDGTEGGNYELVGQTFHLDVPGFIEKVLEDAEDFLGSSWVYPTLQGPNVDLYLLLNL